MVRHGGGPPKPKKVTGECTTGNRGDVFFRSELARTYYPRNGSNTEAASRSIRVPNYTDSDTNREGDIMRRAPLSRHRVPHRSRSQSPKIKSRFSVTNSSEEARHEFHWPLLATKSPAPIRRRPTKLTNLLERCIEKNSHNGNCSGVPRG